MIRSFADDDTGRIRRGLRVRRLPPDIQAVALRKLMLIDAAERIDDLRVPPGNRLEALKGDRRGQWSIRINGQWRICFKWVKGYAEDIETIDDH
jgi:proteic killer suppression protein